MFDEREGLPSASSFPRIHGPDGCLGSFLLEKHLKDPSDRRAANRGDKIHAAMEGRIPMESLGKSERICAERMAYEEGKMVEELGFEGATQFKEQRFWVSSKDGKKLFSAKPDVVHVKGKKIFVINFKSGFYPVEPISENQQMICEGVASAFAGNMLFDEVSIGLIHPNYKEQDKISQFLTMHINAVKVHLERMAETAAKAVQPDALFNPNEKNCQFCLGKKTGACSVYQEWKNGK